MVKTAYNRQTTVSADSAQVVVLRLAVAGQVEGVRGSAQIHDEVNHLYRQVPTTQWLSLWKGPAVVPFAVGTP